MSDYDNLFKLFAKQPQNTLPVIHLHSVLYQASFALAQNDLIKTLRQLNLDLNEELTQEEFNQILNYLHETGIGKIGRTKLREAFRVFDREKTDHIHVGLLRNILNEQNVMSVDEVDELIRILEADENGMINYEALVRKICGKDD